MSFTSLLYGVFLFSVCILYWSSQSGKTRFLLLAIASLIFYASWQPQYLPLLLAMTWVNYSLAKVLVPDSVQGSHGQDWQLSNQEWQFAQAGWNQRRFFILVVGIILNVFLLFGFKYIPFVLGSVGQIWQIPTATASADWVSDNVIAPLGLSFFCFEAIAYLVDVYRGAPAAKSFTKFAAYKLFFPKLISGPITLYQQLTTQLRTPQFPSIEMFTEGLWLIALGATKKALVADRLGMIVDLSFTHLVRAGSWDLWLATLAYGLQLFLDFSGYVDIVRGSAILLGLTLPENFEDPYFTTSIADFWRRWHMTLGNWLRNYLYFPLGGSRLGLFRTCFNLLIVMFIAGIWHGAAWGFIVWGVYHGLALVIHRLMDSLSKQSHALKAFWQSLLGTLLAWVITQFMVFTAWIFFRLPNLKDSWFAISHLFGKQADPQFTQKIYLDTLGIDRLQFTWILCALVSLMTLLFLLQRRLNLQLNWPIKLVLIPVSLYLVWLLAPQGALPYIYFDF
ncbi:MBOAT family protein [Roseofilum reptotaenium CS-1145]|uniref:Membrane-bound O-acyltransferase family protein n=1 Tax=Roseofilum reptotaenium AO1-A TaxID=1925591 RepID=A0A1L9QWI2_9CYAN|nr:MBOAT family O-acyltransferase [Roseofilum reptotaenium]MDB9518546.1 MBOAT family protein [Roseofilum reptotaenium CS-1145]OJJ27051.1 membrane-bound O-acyltransferase family protein [Roseofilum reptotaenium AO1-A]